MGAPLDHSLLVHAPLVHVTKPSLRAPISSALAPASAQINMGVIAAAPDDRSTPFLADTMVVEFAKILDNTYESGLAPDWSEILSSQVR